MKIKFFISIMIIASAVGCKTAKITNSADAVSNVNIENINKIDSLINNLIEDKKTAGFQLGVLIGDSEPILKEYGISNLENNKPVRSTDQFRIASITKPFTAAAILKLVELGKLSLNDTIDKFFPNYPNGKNITVYQLLSHTSGIPNWWDGEIQGEIPVDFPMSKHPHTYLQKMKKASLFDPGEFYSYSNSGYILLGEIIEKVSNLSYNSFLQESIFRPAGMTNTEMEFVERGSENWVKGYALDTKKDVPFVQPEIYHMPFSAGGLRSTALDLIKFIKAMNSGKIISKELLTKMTSYAILNSGKPVYEGNYVAPNSKPSKPQESMEKRGYGLGFNLMELYGTPVFYHSGGIAGFNSIIMYVPKSNTTLVFLANTEDGIIPQLKEIRKATVQFVDVK